MSDHTWEDHVKPAFNAAAWVLEQLENTFKMLDDNGESNNNEFAVAKEQVHAMALTFTKIRNECYEQRERV